MFSGEQSVKNLRNYGSIFLIAVGISFLLAAITTLVLFLLVLQGKEDLRLDIGLNQPWYYRRTDWGAIPELDSKPLELPLPHVMIGHSALQYCMDDCVAAVQDIQKLHMERGWHDIGPNFLVGPNGIVFEGRGANLLGGMTSGWNSIGLSVMFLGDYTQSVPTDAQFDNVGTMLEQLVAINVLRANYTVLGHCQVISGTISPGQNVVDNMHRFEHWDSANWTACLRVNRD